MIYMKVDGMQGNVTARGHENWIQLESLEFSAKRKLNTQPGRIADREGSRPAVSEFIITKRMDKTSPLIFNEAVVGTAKSQVLIDLNTTNNSLTPYMQYTLYNVIVSGYHIINANEETKPGAEDHFKHHPLERITLNFDKIEMKYTPFDQNHKPQSPIPSGYDLKEAVST